MGKMILVVLVTWALVALSVYGVMSLNGKQALMLTKGIAYSIMITVVVSFVLGLIVYLF